MSEPEIEEGWVETEVREEHPGLRLRWIDLPGAPGPTSEELRSRLAYLSSRSSGAQAIKLRRDPIPHAYRVFFRTVGLDPDTERTPMEQVLLERLVHGGYEPRDRVSDALLLGVVETGVPLWAFDRDRLDGPLGVRPARARERLGTHEHANELPAGRLVVADARGPVAVLFGEAVAEFRPGPATRRLRIATLQVEGVPELHVEEALWMCAEALQSVDEAPPRRYAGRSRWWSSRTS